MSTPLLDRLLTMPSHEQVIDKNQYLFHQSDNVSFVYYVLDGEIHLIRHHRDGTQLVMQRATANSVLAEASVFSDNYHCDGVAIRHSRVLKLDRKVFLRAFSDDFELTGAWSQHLANEVRNARQRAEILSLKTVKNRLDTWITANGGELPPKGGWKTLATELAVSAEALYRELSRRRG